ncbi:MAG: hypothetical protein WAK71_09785 [Streptosporangiaceae bacterium]
MVIQIAETAPPHREGIVAEFNVLNDGAVEIPAEVYSDGGRLKLTIYSRDGHVAWEFYLADFIQAVGNAMAVVGA